MSPLFTRIAVLLVISVATWLAVIAGRNIIESQRRRALSAAPLLSGGVANAAVRILVFSSADCRQCHTMQAPAVQRVLVARGDVVSAEEIDAPNTPELAERYHVMTVPTTVVLDSAGRAHAVNYGFTSTVKLLTQIDALLQ